MRVSRSLRGAAAVRRAVLRARHVTPLAVVLLAGACRDVMTPEPRPIVLAPTDVRHTLTGGTGTMIFPVTVDPDGFPVPRGEAFALNGSGQVTGIQQNLPGNTTTGDYRPFRWTPGSDAVHIDGGKPGTAFGLDINDAGVIAGYTQNGAGGIRAVRAVGNTMVILDTLPGTLVIDGFTRAVAINNAGLIVGSAASVLGGGNQGPTRPVLWNTANQIQDLGTLGGSTGIAFDINDAGQVIGTSTLAGDATTHFFLWSSGTGMLDLSVQLPDATSLLAINNAGQIAGTFTTAGGESHAFLYTPGSGIQDLGTLGGTSSAPTGLNNDGEVVGRSTTAGGATHAFLWTPAGGMEDVTAITGFPSIIGLNDQLQTLGQIPGVRSNGTNGPQLVQLTVTAPPAGNAAPVASFTATCKKRQCTFDA
jgi:probable HAF family extracellular repeat protein